jgi:hypothetical protein
MIDKVNILFVGDNDNFWVVSFDLLIEKFDVSATYQNFYSDCKFCSDEKGIDSDGAS